MFWSQSQTDKDWTAQHLVNEQLRHERLARENSIISPIETTPAGEPIPKRSMSQHRQDQLQQQAKSVLDIMNTDNDFIPDL